MSLSGAERVICVSQKTESWIKLPASLPAQRLLSLPKNYEARLQELRQDPRWQAEQRRAEQNRKLRLKEIEICDSSDNSDRKK